MHSILAQSLLLRRLNYYEIAVELLGWFAGPVVVNRMTGCLPMETVPVGAFGPGSAAAVVVVAVVAATAEAAVSAAVVGAAGVFGTGGLAEAGGFAIGVAVAGWEFQR